MPTPQSTRIAAARETSPADPQVARWRALLLALVLLAVGPLDAAERRGMARVIDGDSLEIDGIEMRLQGIDAPEWGQRCQRNGREYDCGAAARDAAAALIARRPVNCRWSELDRYGRALATCYVNGENLNARLVSEGHALAYRRYSDAYVSKENAARRARRGLWAGTFEAPWDWRKHKRGRGARNSPRAADCPVKGNVNRKGERIYHDRSSPSHARVRINPAEGDRCFRTTKEARAAGFRAPR